MSPTHSPLSHPGRAKEVLQSDDNIHLEIFQVAAKNVSDVGALMMPFDRPEQGLDMIQEAMGHVGLTPGEDFFIALNLAGHEIFDYVSMNGLVIITFVHVYIDG